MQIGAMVLSTCVCQITQTVVRNAGVLTAHFFLIEAGLLVRHRLAAAESSHSSSWPQVSCALQNVTPLSGETEEIPFASCFLPQVKNHLFIQLWIQRESGNKFLLQLNHSPYGTSHICPPK